MIFRIVLCASIQGKERKAVSPYVGKQKHVALRADKLKLKS